jgi:GST-like protein
MLEEMGIAYDCHRVDLVNGEHKTEFYTKINPNQKIPTLVHTLPSSGEDFAIFESGAILMYLADTFDEGRLYLPCGSGSESDRQQRHEIMQWLFWQMANLGPMQGQAVTFTRYAPEPIPFALDRYFNETKR